MREVTVSVATLCVDRTMTICYRLNKVSYLRIYKWDGTYIRLERVGVRWQGQSKAVLRLSKL